MERFRELEKGFKKKQFSQRTTKNSKGLGGAHGQGPRCKKRMAAELGSGDEAGEDFNYGGEDSNDEFDHGSDCNCAGSDNEDDDEVDFGDDDLGQDEDDEVLSTEEAIASMRGFLEFFTQLVSKLEGEIDKCKKARGPNVKKMKERASILGVKVEHARILKAKLSDIH